MKHFLIALMGTVCLTSVVARAEEGTAPHDHAAPPAASSEAPPPPPAPTEAVDITTLQPYQAVYKVSLGHGQAAGPIAAASGHYYVDLTMSCTGSSNVMRMASELTQKDGEKLSMSTESKMWESRDGLSVSVNTSATRNTATLDAIVGGARVDTVGGEGLAVLQQGSAHASEVKIPAGTFFPSSFTLSLLRAMSHGVKTTEATVFDGQDSVEGLAKMSIDIAGPRALSSAVAGVHGVNPEDKVWDISISTKRPGLGTAAAPMTGTMALMKNGIAESLTYTMGGSNLVMTLESLELKERPTCP